MENTYLHPNYFKPSLEILKKLGLTFGERYVILRLVSWGASHDLGQKGFSSKTLINLVDEIKNYAKVFISAEDEIPNVLKKYQLTVNPTKIHDVLSFADLFIGEGATMASESAIIGTPSIFVNSLTAGTLEDQQKKGLLYIFNSSEGLIEKSIEILKDKELIKKTRKKSLLLLKNKPDLNNFFFWLISQYPQLDS